MQLLSRTQVERDPSTGGRIILVIRRETALEGHCVSLRQLAHFLITSHRMQVRTEFPIEQLL